MPSLKNSSHFLSVIVPVYKQENTVVQDIKNIAKTLDQIRYDYEIIAIVDGTNIDKSYKKLKLTKLNNLKVYGYPTNFGKGFPGLVHQIFYSALTLTTKDLLTNLKSPRP